MSIVMPRALNYHGCCVTSLSASLYYHDACI